MRSIDPKSLSTSQLHGYLLSAVAPRPIAFASTVDADGKPNLSPFSFFNVFSANPPIMIFSPARRVRDNTTKHTLENAQATKEVVINVVTYDMVHQMSLSSTEYPEGVNEFEKAGLTMVKSDLVKPFRIGEAPVQFECKISEIISLGTEGGAGNLIICEVVKLHIVDSFPDHVKNSMILTGNNLGMLGNVEALPTDESVNAFIKEVGARYPNIKAATHREKHKLARNYLSFGDVESAWKILLS
jgi:flavin reductase (DIM6/NTAB) family NADH-FMN oxidoreductase RutF